jgi:DNA-binding phage protein
MHAPLAETPAAAADDAIARVLAGARIADENAFLDALVARRIGLGWSNEALERAAGLCQGHVTKCFGPARLRSPSLATVDKVMAALGLSFVLVVDPEKARGDIPPKRVESKVRQRLSSATVERAQPVILATMLRKAVQRKWRGVDAKDFLKAQMGVKP